MHNPNMYNQNSQPLSIPDVSHVLVIASGKGGVGKTTVTVNLALALCQRGLRVGLFDADLYGPNIPAILGVHRSQPGYGMITENSKNRVPYIQPLSRFGLKVMSIGFLVSDTQTITPHPFAAGQIIRQTLEDVKWGNLDYLLIDFPPGSGEPQSTLVHTIKIDGAVIVTTPQELSLIDASRSIGMFQNANIPILGVVENMSYLNCPHCGKSVDVFNHSNREWPVQGYQVAQLGRLPLDMEISLPVNEMHPLVSGKANPRFDIFQNIALKIIANFPD
jgi:ATP-binding protein involved in chromosome partitioning